MSLKEKMMDGMMGNMSADEKKEMMNKMMEKFFSDMSPEEKQKMMQDMMSKMMGGGGGFSMMDMMKNMMGGMMGGMGSDKLRGSGKGSATMNFNPMEMCQKMMSSISKSNELASFATPEIRGLFEEWIQQIEEEFLSFIKESGTNKIEKIQEHFKLTKDSIIYILTRLGQKGKIKFNIESDQNI